MVKCRLGQPWATILSDKAFLSFQQIPTAACTGSPINPASGGAEGYMDKVDKTEGERK